MMKIKDVENINMTSKHLHCDVLYVVYTKVNCSEQLPSPSPSQTFEN